MEMFYTEMHGVFLKWIVLREMHGGVSLFLVSSFRFYWHDCHPERSRRLMKIVLHRDARSFFEVDCVERNAWRSFTFFGFKFQVLLTRLSPWAESKANGNVLHRDTRRFFEVDCVERDAWSRFTFFGFKFQIFECWILNFLEHRLEELD